MQTAGPALMLTLTKPFLGQQEYLFFYVKSVLNDPRLDV